MNLLRILILLALFWLLYRMIKGFLNRPQATERPAATSQKMVRCAYCELHIPESEALISDGHYYCSREHKDADRPS